MIILIPIALISLGSTACSKLKVCRAQYNFEFKGAADQSYRCWILNNLWNEEILHAEFHDTSINPNCYSIIIDKKMSQDRADLYHEIFRDGYGAWQQPSVNPDFRFVSSNFRPCPEDLTTIRGDK